MKTIAERISERRTYPYKEASRKFDVTYDYVRMIAAGRRKANRGKGAEIKEWLEKQLQITKR